MEKKPKLLDKKKLIIACDSTINFKIIEQALKNINDFESLTENDMTKFLARIFTFEPKLVIVAHENSEASLRFVIHIRNNSSFSDLPIICITDIPPKEGIVSKLFSFFKKGAKDLNINYFSPPINNAELTKVIKQFLEN
jgi:hypothetical protein